MTKRILALCRQAPYGNALAREGLEAVLAAAAMDQVADLLFCGDGVFQLLPEQSPAGIGQKSLQRNLQALPLFGVEQAYVCTKSLAQRGLDLEALSQGQLPLVPVDDSAALIATYDSVLSF
ncbi:tRNA 2-thiouridine synthesizing protein C [Microbulbifer donghaiensis]|uniref:tRNA 2-thiouridine synthesizing protein C n=1 Tax=Microbulbifer donghaiensis TaxID=494016 RepID=A0A1M4VBB7_9GAMM|nr:sulfurtransferase complex subunit TusC [Microbulbifer donghaiensis]SHE66226.1 tRNA 2-thiouridine synthesizing protein C [Microbulbifer donghaiensis]